MRWLIIGLPLVLVAAASPALRAGDVAFHFTEVGAQRGILPFDLGSTPMMGLGLAAADYDGDGDIDFFVPNGAGGPPHLYRNDDGVFVEVAAQVGIQTSEHQRSALWFDYDGDHDLDLVIGNDDYLLFTGVEFPYRLFRQDADGSFSDVTLSSGLVASAAAGAHRGGISVGDINQDGYLDLIGTMWNGAPQLFLNGGDGTFSDISDASGLLDADFQNNTWQALFHDFDGDGYEDIYLLVDFYGNRLYRNNGDNTFTDIAAESGSDIHMHSMGGAMGDYDNDGDFDIYITNIDFPGVPIQNVMLTNLTEPGSVLFENQTTELGVGDGGWGWGTTFFDADRDQWLDLASTNGWSFGVGHVDDTTRFFRNLLPETGAFEDQSAEVTIDDALWGSCLVALDYDRDGDQDLLQTVVPGPMSGSAIRLLENDIDVTDPSSGYLVVKPRMSGSNHRAIGAVVRAEVGGVTLSRPITAGTSFMGQEPAEAFFGLGDADTAHVTVEFPDGSQTVVVGVAANQVIDVQPPRFICGDVNSDAFVDIADAVYLLSYLYLDGPVISCQDAADADGSNTVDLGDVLHIFGYRLLGGPPPAAPFPGCGHDLTPYDGTHCRHQTPCP